jgi:TRAP-type C4-dicarboxylate transport system permease small subunit
MERASKIVHLVTKTALIVVLSVMALVVFLQVIFRYVLDLPLFWTEEFARYCLVWASLLGAAVAMKRGQHLAVTICMDRLPPGAHRVLSVVARLSVIVILAVIVVGGIQLVLLTRAQISPALRVPMSIPYLAVPVGAAIMLFHAIVFLFQPRPRTDTDS